MRKFPCCYLFIYVSLLLISCFSGNSHAAVSEEGTYTLGEVVVSAQKETVEAVGTVREITSKDIEARGVRTLDEALELLPGVHVRTGADGTPRIDLRGFRSRHVLLLLDGIPFNSTFDAQFDPSIIPAENISRIKISYGTNSVLYGQGGLAGVINIITKKGTKGVQGEVRGEIRERNAYLGQASVSGAKDKIDFLVSGSRSNSDGYPLSESFKATSLEDGDLRNNSDRERSNLFANMGYAPTDSLKLGVVFNHMQGEYGKPPITIDKKADPDFGKSPKYERVDDYTGNSGQLSAQYDLSSNINFRGWAFINTLDEDAKLYDDNTYSKISKSGSYYRNDKTTTGGGAFQTLVNMECAGSLTAGLSYEDQGYTSSGEEILKSGKGLIDIDRDLQIYSASLEYEVSPLENVGFVLGYSYNWLNKETGEQDGESAYMAGVYYDLTSSTRIRGSFARKIRFPSIRQLYEPVGGDPNLTTEKSYNYEVGVEQKLGDRSRLAIVGFIQDVEDYIEKIDDVFKNNDKYTFRGFEVTGETRPLDNLLLRASYSFLYSEDRSPNPERNELQYRPKNQVAIETQYRFDVGLSLYGSYQYIGEQYDYSTTTPVEKRKVEAYSLVNFKIDQKILNDRMTLYAGINNLFDRDYEESIGYPREGRMVFGGMTIRF